MCRLTGRAARANDHYKRAVHNMELLNTATKVLKGASKLLNDPFVEDSTLTPDRVGGTVSLTSTMANQAMTGTRTVWNPPEDISDTTNAMAMSKAIGYVNPQKMVQVSSNVWTTTDALFTTVSSVNLPQDLYPSSAFPARGPTRYFAYVRTGFTFNVAVNAAPGMAGCLLVVYQPAGSIRAFNLDDATSLPLLPHAYINLSSASSAQLVIPYVNDTPYTETDGADLGMLKVYVWAQLRAPTGSPTLADVTIFGSLNDLDLQAPRPQMRTKIDIAEGPGALNLASSISTRNCQTFAIADGSADPDDTTMGSMEPVMDLVELMHVAVPIKTTTNTHIISWSSITGLGDSIYAATLAFNTMTCTGKFLGNVFGFYKGSLIFRLTTFNSIFNKGRLKLAVYPFNTGDFTTLQSNNAFYSILDIGIQSSTEVVLPFHNWARMKDTTDLAFRVEIQVVNRLQYNASSTNTIDLMLTIQGGQDLKLYVPHDLGVTWQGPDETTSVVGTTSVTDNSATTAVAAGLSDVGANGGGPQQETEGAQLVGSENIVIDIYNESHSSIENFFGRAYFVGEETVVAGLVRAITINFPYLGHATAARAFTYWFGEPIFHVTNRISTPLTMCHSYNTFASYSRAKMFSMGAVIVPAGQSMSIAAPWYTEVSAGYVRDDVGNNALAGMGTLMLYSEAAGEVDIALSFRKMRLYFPRGIPLVSNSDAAESDDEIEEQGPPMGGFKRLALSGDVEENPGPVELVYLDRGLYKHYGVRVDDYVIHMDSANVLESALSGQVVIVKADYTDDWKTSGEVLDPESVRMIAEASVGFECKFSANFNCETFARAVCGDDGMTHARGLAMFGLILALLCGAKAAQGEPGARLKQFGGAVKEKMNSAMSAAASLLNGTMISNMIDQVSGDIVKTVCKFLVRIVCYGILYCSCPNLLTTGALIGLIGLDVSSLEGLGDSAKALFHALVNGEMWEAVEALTNFANLNNGKTKDSVAAAIQSLKEMFDMEQQGPAKDFNEFSLAAKNLDWWMTMVSKFFKCVKQIFAPDGCDVAKAWVAANEDKIVRMCAEIDHLVLKANTTTASRDSDFQKEVKHCIERAVAMKKIMLTAQCYSMLNQYNQALSKLQNIKFGPPVCKGIYRMEPIGIWISGKPGQGKSFLAIKLIEKLAAKLNVPVTDVFPHPVASEFFDGYAGQTFHYIDDLGQSRKENDLEQLCQCISSTAYTVPMADLSQKGTMYTSKIVIATTNKPDFTSMALTDPGALDRRFAFKLFIRANEMWTAGGKLNVKSAQEKGAMDSGVCWDYAGKQTDAKKVMNLDKLVDKIVAEYHARMTVVTGMGPLMQQAGVNGEDELDEVDLGDGGGEFDFQTKFHKLEMSADELRVAMSKFEEDGEFDGFECNIVRVSVCKSEVPAKITERMKKWVSKQMHKIKETWERFRPWAQLAAVLTGIGSLALGGYTAYLMWRSNNTQEVISSLMNHVKREKKDALFKDVGDLSEPERAYNGLSKFINPKKIGHVYQQGPQTNEWLHLTKMCCFFVQDGHKTYAVASGGKSLYVFSHIFNLGGTFSPDKIVWNGLEHSLVGTVNSFDDISVRDADGQILKCDLVRITIPTLPWQFKSINQYLADPETGQPGVLTYMTGSGAFSQEVTCITAAPMYETRDVNSKFRTYGAGIRYVAKTSRGSCGGLLIQKQRGAWKILGMHVAGNGTYGYSTRLFPEVQPEGEIVKKIPAPSPLFNQSKTQLQPSPLHGLVPSTMAPAVLHPRDTRIEIDPPENLVKHAASKYRVNVFCPDELSLDTASNYVTKKLFETTGMCGMLSLDDALNGVGALNRLDMKTSAGPVYNKQGVKKSDLIEVTATGLKASPRFEHDVSQCIEAVRKGNASVLFGANLKDEVLNLKKIKEARTRCIEACGVDFTVAYRMVMGDMYAKIYSGNPLISGIAVGINPYVDYHDIRLGAYRYLYALDYSKYDGSIPEGLMNKAVEVMATCHEDPEIVHKIHDPVVTSTHWVSDEFWTVRGGMPSGSPCTSVLNSLVNVLLLRSILVYMGHDMDEVQVMTYGDDVIMSTVKPVDGEKLVQYIKDWYGMEATNARKDGCDLSETWDTVTFLKRRFALFPGTAFVTGVLDLDSILQKIQWCHSRESFTSQLESATLELALHGREVYDEFRVAALEKMKDLKIFIPTFDVRIMQVYKMFFG